jgi:hypothetical protein
MKKLTKSTLKDQIEKLQLPKIKQSAPKPKDTYFKKLKDKLGI